MRSRFLLAVALLLGVSTVTSAQVTGTVMPSPKFEAFNALGTAPCASCRLHAYVAGTTNNQDTYSDVTLATPNANPIVLDSAGRATVFLSANSYKFVLKDANDSATIWTQDNISATASFSVATDITGTAGEALSAGQAVYLSDGSGALVAGRWYLADADFTYASSAAAAIGITPAAITSGSAGAIRITGRSTNLVGLVSGTTYYVSATAGSLTSTSPTNSRVVGVADSTTTLVQSGSVTNLALLNAANVFTNAAGNTMRKAVLSGSTSGSVTLTVPATAGANTLTLPAGTTDLSATGGANQVVQQTTAGGALTVGTINAASIAAGTLGVANGGTGAATLTANNLILGNGTSAVAFVAPGTSGNIATSNGSTWASAIPVSKGYTATVANVQTTAAITTICSFTVGANEMASGDVLYVEMPSLTRNTKGTAGTITWTFSWNGTTVASAAQTESNSATEFRAGYKFRMVRVGADLWITGGSVDRTQADENLYLRDLASLGVQDNYLITAPDFTTSQAVLIRATLSAADANFYIKPQAANVYKMTKQ